MSLPLDSDGFLRRECPSCKREFKWLPTQGAADAEPAAETYYCPYCYEAAAPNSWYTKAQVEVAGQVVQKEALEPRVRSFLSGLKSLERPGGSFRVEVNPPSYPQPTALTEPDDMDRVDFPCHPQEPLKVDPTWNEEVGCLVCGFRYPVDLVRALPNDEPSATI